MKCPRCKGYIWTEQEKTGDHRECAEKYGLEVVCVGGHRFKLTPDDYKKYIKRRKKNGNCLHSK